MKEELEFQECQRFNQWRGRWVILLFFSIIGIFIYGCIVQLGMGKPFGDNPMPDAALIIVTIGVTVIIVLLMASFYFMRLDTLINEDGVYERMFPFQFKFGFTPWDNIIDAAVIEKNFRGKYKQWGMRKGFREKSFTTSGNKTLQLTIKNDNKILTLLNNKKIYIGTQKPEEMADFLDILNAKRKQK